MLFRLAERPVSYRTGPRGSTAAPAADLLHTVKKKDVSKITEGMRQARGWGMHCGGSLAQPKESAIHTVREWAHTTCTMYPPPPMSNEHFRLDRINLGPN